MDRTLPSKARRNAIAATSSRPLAAHVHRAIQACYGAAPRPDAPRATAQMRAVGTGRALAPHVAAAVHASVNPSGSVQAAVRGRSFVVQRSDTNESSDLSFSLKESTGGFEKKSNDYQHKGSYVAYGNSYQGTCYPGVWTDQVRPCYVLCMFGGEQMYSPAFMIHSSNDEAWILGEALKKRKFWKTNSQFGFEPENLKTYIIGGDQTRKFNESILLESKYAKLKVVGVHSPLSQSDNEFGCVEMINGKVNYWFEYSD